jgi:hypothetical protein
MDSNENLVMRSVIEDHGITVKQLEIWTGYDATHLYACLSGNRLAAPHIWRVLYAKTQDARIPKIITGDLPVMVVHLNDKSIRLDAASLKDLLQVRREQLQFEAEILSALEDGRIDAKDRAAITKLGDLFPAMIQSISRVYAAVMAEYQKVSKR